MSSDPRYIIGELVAVGTPEGSEQPRALVHCTQHDIASVLRLPMLQRVAIVPLDLLHGSDAPPIVEENRRLRTALEKIVQGGYADGSDKAHPAISIARGAIAGSALAQVPTEHAEDTEGDRP